jgi:hypothetical protein
MDTFGVTLTKLKRLCHRPNPLASYYFGLRRVLAPIGDLNPQPLKLFDCAKVVEVGEKTSGFHGSWGDRCFHKIYRNEPVSNLKTVTVTV